MGCSSGKALAFSMKETNMAIVSFPSLPVVNMDMMAEAAAPPGGIKPTRKGREDREKEKRSLRAWLSCCFYHEFHSSRFSKLIIYPDLLHIHS